MIKNQHGGKRKGAGRKKKEPTIIVRIPVSLIPEVQLLKEINSNNWEDEKNINKLIMLLKNRSEENQLSPI